MWTSKEFNEVSWFEQDTTVMVERIVQLVPDRSAPNADVGSGASVLIDELLSRGYSSLFAVDLSGEALERTKSRLTDPQHSVTFKVVSALDIRFDLPLALWHDRALFHFFTEPADIAEYRLRVRESLSANGYVVISTFAEDGPEQCSGLPVARYSSEELAHVFADDFSVVDSWRSIHRTPWDSEQRFVTVILRRT